MNPTTPIRSTSTLVDRSPSTARWPVSARKRSADAIGVTFQQVQKYEKGTNRIGASRLYMIGHALDVPISVFFSGLQGGSDEPDPIPERLAREGIELQAAFRSIQDAGTRRHLVELARAIANDSSGTTSDRTH